jgi:hypothetical protein
MSRFRKKKAAEKAGEKEAEGSSLGERVAGGEAAAYEALQLQKSRVSRLRVAGRLDEVSE